MTSGVGPRSRAAVLIAALACLLVLPSLAQQPLQPPPVAKYRVKLRYHIPAPRDQHVKQYDAMIEYLKSLKFKFDPPLEDRPETDREDRGKNELEGQIGPGNPLRLLGDPSVASVLLVPADLKLPNDPNQPVKVRLELPSGYSPDRQLTLANQVLVLLGQLGFTEADGYDHRGYTGRPHTRLVGTVPVHQLETLLKDLRNRPGGWFAPAIAREDLPLPLRRENPILVTEVLREPAPARELVLPEPLTPAYMDKVSPELAPLVSDKDRVLEATRLEIILTYTPGDDDRLWWSGLKAHVPEILLEGRLGSVVTCVTRVGYVRKLAALPQVSTIRLPRLSYRLAAAEAKFATDNKQVLEKSGLARLHQLGKRGKLHIPGTLHYPKAKDRKLRLAILDDDFSGVAELIEEKKLPADTRLVDLTIQRDSDLYPAPRWFEPQQHGHGTQCALAAHLAAPDAQLTLVRVDPRTPYQVQDVARYINGEPLVSPDLERRRDELAAEAAVIATRRAIVLKERRLILDDFQDEADFAEQYGLLGDAVTAWLFSPRQWSLRRLAEVERDDLDHRRRELRLLKLMEDLATLRGIDLVCCTFSWPDRYPLSGSSYLSRWFDQTPQKALWLQSAGSQRRQTWYGLYRDADGNGVMEFAPPGTKLDKGQWTTELNFLKWEPFVPAGNKGPARLRISLQWREPHDPDYYFRPGEEDRYRTPLAELRVTVLRQRDPSGKVLPTDDFEPVAVTYGAPQRLDNRPNMATYEQGIEFTIERSSRYAAFVVRQQPERWDLIQDRVTGRYSFVLERGLAPTGIRPLGAPSLEAFEKKWELWPRLFVECVDPLASTAGRPVFETYHTDQGSIGMLADARTVVTVGAAQLSDQPGPYASLGPPMGLTGYRKPNVLAYDALDVALPERSKVYGSDLATAFATGQAACLMSAGMSRTQVAKYLLGQNGAVLRVPKEVPRK